MILVYLIWLGVTFDMDQAIQKFPASKKMSIGALAIDVEGQIDALVRLIST